MGILIACDIGGTKIQVAAATTSGEILRRTGAPTPRSLADGLAYLRSTIAELKGPDRIVGVGATLGGPLNAETGVASPLHQAEWRNVPIVAHLQSWTGAPSRIAVDTDAAALAEFRRGAHGVHRLLYVTVSTGIGGGFITDGQIFHGVNGCHPEFGHQSVPSGLPERVPCACGSYDCLEALVSGTSLQKRFGRPAAELDDAVWADAGRLLGIALRNATTLLAPEVVALGGGVVTGAGEKFVAPARRVVEEGTPLVPKPRVVISALGYDTALLGAVELARDVSGIGA